MAEGLMRLMGQFGFSARAARCYTTLLTQGPMSSDKMSIVLAMSPRSLLSGLEHLLQLGLIATDRRRNRTVYYAKDPSLAWLAIVADLVWSTDIVLAPIRNLPETSNPNIEHLRMLATEISDSARRLYRPHVGVLLHRVRDADAFDELAQLTCEAIGQARDTVRAVSRSPRLPQVSSFWAALTNRIEHGVRYTRIVDLDEIIDHGLDIVSRDMQEYHIDLRVLERTQLHSTFYVVDDRLLAMHHAIAETRDDGQHGVGRVTSQAHIIARYLRRFEGLYARSIPGAFAVKHLREAGMKLLVRAAGVLAPSELEWLRDCVSFGKFSRFAAGRGWSEARRAAVEVRAHEAALVRRDAEGHIVPCYGVSDDALRAAYEASLAP